MLQNENFELFDHERINATMDIVDNDIFHTGSISPNFNTATETYESIIKIEAETLQFNSNI